MRLGAVSCQDQRAERRRRGHLSHSVGGRDDQESEIGRRRAASNAGRHGTRTSAILNNPICPGSAGFDAILACADHDVWNSCYLLNKRLRYYHVQFFGCLTTLLLGDGTHFAVVFFTRSEGSPIGDDEVEASRSVASQASNGSFVRSGRCRCRYRPFGYLEDRFQFLFWSLFRSTLLYSASCLRKKRVIITKA